MLGGYRRKDEENDQSGNELNLDSDFGRPQRNSNLTGEDFRSLLTNRRENSETTIEKTKLINEESSNQMSRRLNEIETSRNSQIQDAITYAITSTVLPSIQNTLEMQGRANFTMVYRGLARPHPGPRAANSRIYNGTPKQKMLRKRAKIVPKGVLCKKTADKCLDRVQ